MLKTQKGNIVPLKSINIHNNILERIANSEYKYNYVNEENNPIEAVFVFKLSAGASVYSFEARTDSNKVIVALCKEKLEAKKEYNKAIKDGNTGFYMDNNDNGNAFRICIGNLAPLTGVQITIKIVHELTIENSNSKLQLNIPTTMSKKYIPQYRLESKSYNLNMTNPSTTLEKPFNMTITGNINMGSKLVSVESKTHKIKLSNMEKNSAHFEITNLEKLNKDVVLTIERESSFTTAFTQQLPQSSLSTLRNPILKFCTAVNLIPDFSKMPKVNINDCEYVLCLDVSGSMRG